MEGLFEVLDAEHPMEQARWIDVWGLWPLRQVFAHPRYVSLYTTGRDHARCALYQGPEGFVLYPFIQRDLNCEPYVEHEGCRPALSDIITPYGYGGPFAWGASDKDALATAFWREFFEWATSTGVVSEFIRFHLFEDAMLPYPGVIEDRYANVVRSLDIDEQTLWMDFEHKTRKNVKKAQRSGVVVEIDASGDRLDDFLRIYNSTMSRRGALSSYSFPRDYFEQIGSGLSGQYVYFHAVLDGHVISTELVLVSADCVYSFLGGTDSDYFELRPNDLLKYEVIRWAQAEGKRYYVLGGGYEQGDGIYRYKTSFAPSGAYQFRVGHRIWMPAQYERLVESRRALALTTGSQWEPRPDFFPVYRA